MQRPYPDEFKIHHLSIRSPKRRLLIPERDVSFFYVRIVFSCGKDAKEAFKASSTNWEKRITFIGNTPPEEFSLKDATTVHVFNLNPLVRYIEKFNVFVFTEAVNDCAISKACIETLRGLQHGYNPSRFTKESLFRRTLETLDIFWD